MARESYDLNKFLGMTFIPGWGVGNTEVEVQINPNTKKAALKIGPTYLPNFNQLGWYLKGKLDNKDVDSRFRPDKLIEKHTGKSLYELHRELSSLNVEPKKITEEVPIKIEEKEDFRYDINFNKPIKAKVEQNSSNSASMDIANKAYNILKALNKPLLTDTLCREIFGHEYKYLSVKQQYTWKYAKEIMKEDKSRFSVEKRISKFGNSYVVFKAI